MTGIKVVGLDLSLASTGIAVATQGGAITDRITTKPTPNPTLTERRARLHVITARIRQHTTAADLVVIEATAYDSKSPHTHERAGLWWLVVDRLIADGLDVVEVTTGGLKKYATGRGGAAKDDVLSAVIRRYPHVDVNGNDEADALILAAMGARHLGHPLEPTKPDTGTGLVAILPKAHLAAMGAVHWPNPDRITA